MEKIATHKPGPEPSISPAIGLPQKEPVLPGPYLRLQPPEPVSATQVMVLLLTALAINAQPLASRVWMPVKGLDLFLTPPNSGPSLQLLPLLSDGGGACLLTQDNCPTVRQEL